MNMDIKNPHLQAAYDEFLDKCAEIERFLNFVDDLDQGSDNTLLYKNKLNLWSIKPISREVQKTLRATCYLLIYNLLESTTCETLDSIHLTLNSESRDLQELSDNLKIIVFSNLKQGLGDGGIKKIIEDEIDLRTEILKHGYSKRNFLSGNFDIEQIKKVIKKYGFSLQVFNGANGKYDTEVIRIIKNKRNALAHGSESFEQCGQNIPLFSMQDNYINARNALLALFNGINKYLNQQKYLKVIP